MTINLRTSLNTGLNSGLRQSISGGVNGLGFFRAASLDLQFASKKTLNDRVSNSNLITFTRASSGTYVDGNGIIQSATTNTPRFDHDPATGESLGLLIEEARTNELLYSQEFDNNWWLKANSVITANAATSPAGDTTAEQLTPNAVNNTFSVYKRISFTSGNTYTQSIFAKANTYSVIGLEEHTNSGGAKVTSFDLSNGTVGVVNAAHTASIKDFGNGWYRCSITYSCTETADDFVAVRILETINTGSASWTADGTSNLYLYGFQLEQGSFPTSYIPTSGSTVTRAADVAEITGTNFSSFYNQSEGTVFVEAKASGASAVVGFDDGTTAERWRVGYAGSNNSSIVVVDGGVVQTNINTSSNSTPYNQFHKLAGAIAANNLSFAHNGTLSSDSSVSVPVVNALSLGTSIDVSGHINGHIKRLAYFPTRLPDATLQNITS